VAEHLPDERRGPLAAAGLTLVLALLALGGLTSWVVDGAQEESARAFEESADQTALAVERELDAYLDELRDISAFAANAPDASPAEFAGFVEGTGIFEQLPSLVGIFFLHKVAAAEIDAFTEEVRRAIPDFTVTEIGPAEAGNRYVLTYYVPGAVDLELPIGTDITPIASLTAMIDTQGDRREGVAGSFQDDPYLLQVARDTDFTAVDTMLDIDFFIGVPAISSGAGGEPAGEVEGWVGAPVARFADVLEAAGAAQPEDVGLSATIDLDDTGFGDRSDLERVAELPGSAGDRADAAYEISRSVDVDGVNFTIVVWSSPGADRLPATVPALVVGGVTAALLAAAVVYLRQRARGRDRAFTRELRDREHAQRDILDSVTDAMVVLDDGGRLVGANPAWWRLRMAVDDGGTPPMGEQYLAAIEPHLRGGSDALAEGLRRVLDGGSHSPEIDVAVTEGDAHRWYAVQFTPLRGRAGGAVVVHSDITDRKRSHDALALRATRDDLTGLLNRAALEAEADRVLAEARAMHLRVAVLFVDLDGFKPINDEHGHAVGDEVLRAVGRRLTTAVRTTDRVARFGGDEFVVLVGPLGDVHVAEQTARRILHAFAGPVRVEDLDLAVSVSVGVAVTDEDGAVTRDGLLDAADGAMYRAKQSGGATAVTAW
jgi:diguanylate cyclase (GGDEF)-like protein